MLWFIMSMSAEHGTYKRHSGKVSNFKIMEFKMPAVNKFKLVEKNETALLKLLSQRLKAEKKPL